MLPCAFRGKLIQASCEYAIIDIVIRGVRSAAHHPGAVAADELVPGNVRQLAVSRARIRFPADNVALVFGGAALVQWRMGNHRDGRDGGSGAVGRGAITRAPSPCCLRRGDLNRQNKTAGHFRTRLLRRIEDGYWSCFVASSAASNACWSATRSSPGLSESSSACSALSCSAE